MDNFSENDSGSTVQGARKRQSCRIAYSINNAQPVRCTLIHEEPLFYFDEEVSDDLLADEFLDEDYDFMHEELLALKNKIDVYEAVSCGYEMGREEIFLEFLADTSALNEETPTLDSEKSLERVIETLSKSRMAKSLLDFATKNGVTLQCTNQVSTAIFDRKAQKILIRTDMEFMDQVLLTIQELRRHWQLRQGALVHPLTFHPDHAVLVNRAQLADLSVAVVRCAWELRLNGQDQFWARIENSSLQDLGRALAREALIDFRTLNNGKASSAVFETWFLSERCRKQDKLLIQAMLADYRGYVFDSAEASRMISIDLVTALGAQPFGNNYLASYAQMILSDPLFTDVRDRSNANFLWFIKFERCFGDSEQELQSSDENNLFGDRQNNNNSFEDNQYESQGSSSSASRAHFSIIDKSIKPTVNNVIHVQFGKDPQSRTGISP